MHIVYFSKHLSTVFKLLSDSQSLFTELEYWGFFLDELRNTKHTFFLLPSTISAAVLLVVSRFSTNAVSPRKFPDADDSRESKLSSNVFKVILNPFCCFVRSDCK